MWAGIEVYPGNGATSNLYGTLNVIKNPEEPTTPDINTDGNVNVKKNVNVKGDVNVDGNVNVGKNVKAKKDVYLAFRNQFQNENLGDLVKNNAEINKIIEHEGQLIQKSDPVYREASTFRAHFFAPVKHIFGMPVDTFWANIFTIVCMGGFLYFTLYFDLFRKIIEGISSLASLLKK